MRVDMSLVMLCQNKDRQFCRYILAQIFVRRLANLLSTHDRLRVAWRLLINFDRVYYRLVLLLH